MDSEVYSFALKSALDEIRNLCPDVTGAFIFREDGEVVAGDGALSDKFMARVVDAFEGIFDKADAIGGVDGITVDGDSGKVSVSRFNDVYMVIATSKNADVNYVRTVTRVLIPTVMRLLEKICSTPNQNKTETENVVVENKELQLQLKETPVEEEEALAEAKVEETVVVEHREPIVNQLIVENLGGLLVSSDTVRVDPQVLSQWSELYEDIEIKEVEIETFDGKSVRCKVKPVKDSKFEGKGIIQMPEKVQLNLEIKKGELVKVKPIVE